VLPGTEKKIVRISRRSLRVVKFDRRSKAATIPRKSNILYRTIDKRTEVNKLEGFGGYYLWPKLQTYKKSGEKHWF
jgi:hypothetical protein